MFGGAAGDILTGPAALPQPGAGPCCDEYLPEDDAEESLAERLQALTEMFPENIRTIAGKTINSASRAVKKAYSWSRTGVWILFSTSIIAVAPVLLEVERFQMDEMQKIQQRQMLLGPNVARG